MAFILIVTVCFLLATISECNVRPACLHADNQIELTNYPIGGSPISWIMSPGSSLFASPDYLPVTTPPYCESANFRVPSYQRHLNTTFLGSNILTTEKVISTQDLARDFVGLPGLVVIADQQTRGRARASQTWTSPMGDIYMSVNVNLTDRNLSPLLQSIAALSIVNSVHEKLSGYQDIGLTYTWPNSVTWKKLKIAGVLVEQSSVDDTWFTVGIGIRLNSVSGVPTLNSIIAAHNHMHGTLLEPINREELIARVLNNFEILIETMRKDPDLVRDLLASKWISQKKTIHLNFHGIITGIDDNNELVMKDSRGIRVLINPDLHIVSTDDTVLSSSISYQLISSNSIYETE
ncbi:biotin--protein ligase [Tetranychus urticae]|uniref:biotin--protein ligase n=1 Tax=Tetranychus urticae TaxID=32264 RepID=UPI00077BB874|nr:biotin--protein ligase [Tetranychus urticae]